jgi:hypothetical protein
VALELRRRLILLYAFVKTLSLTSKCRWQLSAGIPMLVSGRSKNYSVKK